MKNAKFTFEAETMTSVAELIPMVRNAVQRLNSDYKFDPQYQWDASMVLPFHATNDLLQPARTFKFELKPVGENCSTEDLDVTIHDALREVGMAWLD